VHRNIGDEVLWAASMPCALPEDSQIPIGRYGNSNVGRVKTVYRKGLSHRYGRTMQTISGIHYNFSIPDAGWDALRAGAAHPARRREFRDAAYFGLIRNFRRHTWLLLYLLGTSPAVCKSFVAGREHGLMALGAESMYLPYATSLRMGPLGYQSDAQRALAVSYNNLRGYAQTIRGALTASYPPYERIGIKVDGEYRQLSATLLQIENEFYGTIRPKRRINPGERPLHALGERGVEYVEVRCLDVDPFEPVGINARTMHFLDVFLLHCLLSDSPSDSPAEIARIGNNQHLVAQQGRRPGLKLAVSCGEVPLADWAIRILDECAPIAAVLDRVHGGENYRVALEAARDMVVDPGSTPSALVLERMHEQHRDSFHAFALQQSFAHRQRLLEYPLSSATRARYATMADESLAQQREVEQAMQEPFDQFVERYLAPESLGDFGD
jgi:glutamate--cysteine ligase